MCGIAGIFGATGWEAAATGGALLQSLAHRGPDDHGWLLWDGGGVRRGRHPLPATGGHALLLHTRLSILDLSPAGWQPMSDPSGRWHLVFNGEVYNHLELRRELETAGVAFTSGSDTEVLLKGLIHWGTAALTRLVGMFALALLDCRAGTLLLARDGFGIKPLYLARWRGGTAFASELTALLTLPGLSRQVDPQGACDYLLFGATDHRPGRTLLAAVGQLPPGHHLTVSLDHPLPGPPQPFWRPTLGAVDPLPPAAAAALVRERFLESVALHLRADVPVAAALSGGVDSSALVMAMRHLEPRREIHTFSYLAGDPRWNEKRWVDLVAGAAGCIQHPVAAEPAHFQQEVEALIRIQGEPVTSTSMFAQYRVYQEAAARGFKVVVDGQGADELLAGYDYYLGARLTALLRQGRWGEAAAFARRAAARPGVGRRLALYLGEFLLPPAWQRLPRRLVGESLTPPWLAAEWFQDHGITPRSHRRSVAKEALREQLLETLTRTGLPKLLRYQDRNAMAFSIESRVPFLTPPMAETLLNLPEGLLINGDGVGKAVFRAAMRGIVPDAILERRDKVAFNTPEGAWLRAAAPWVEGVLNGPLPPVINRNGALSAWQRVQRGEERPARWLWRVLNFSRWAALWEVGFSPTAGEDGPLPPMDGGEG